MTITIRNDGSSPSEQNQRIQKIIEAQRLLNTKDWRSWRMKKYWGQIPSASEIMQLGFCGYAITHDVENAEVPDLSSKMGTQVIMGPKSVIIWSASFEEDLDAKIKSTFNQFSWELANE